MNPIDAVKISFQSPVDQTTKSNKQKTNTTSSTKETAVFAKLFESLSTEEVQQVIKGQPMEMIKKLEAMLQALQELSTNNLQELSAETLSVEEQDMLIAALHMLTLQKTDMMDKLQGTGLGQEKLVKGNIAEEKLLTILQQIEQKLQELSALSNKSFENGSEFIAAENKKILSDPTSSEQVLKQLSVFINQLENEQQATGKHSSLQQLEQIEQVLKQMNLLSQQLENTQSSLGQQLDTGRQVTGSTAYQPIGEEVQLQNENSQTLTGPTLDAKTSQVTQRLEASPQTPTVRMYNLIEELGEIVKGSFRFNGTQAGTTQLRVNIFPEHLGHIDIRLTASEGKVAAQIFTSNQLAKEALDLQVNQLRNALNQQGVTIDRIEITQQHSQQSFGQQNAHPDGRSHQQEQGAAPQMKNGYQLAEEEVVVAGRSHSIDGSMKVDYTI